MKRRIVALLLVLLVGSWAIPRAQAAEDFTLDGGELGFSLTVPGLPAEEIAVEIQGHTVTQRHRPSQTGSWGGLLCVLEVVEPRSRLFSGEYDSGAYAVVAMGRDRVILRRALTGVDSGEETMADYLAAADALDLAVLRQQVKMDAPDVLPAVNAGRAYLTAGGAVRPGEMLTRGELAVMLWTLLDGEKLSPPETAAFTDTAEGDCAQAAETLASYGVVTGYGDGTFRPDRGVTRGEFAVLLHRFQFAAPMGQYGDRAVEDRFSDMAAGHWASAHLCSAVSAGWLRGYGDGTLRPDQGVTRAEAVTALNRVLGRSCQGAAVAPELENPFADVDGAFWGYADLLEAAGRLTVDTPRQGDRPLPEGTAVSWFVDEACGFAAAGKQLLRTTDGGVTWTPAAELPTGQVGELFFFDGETGLLCGADDQGRPVLLATADGGVTWEDLLTAGAFAAAELPVEQFPDQNSALTAVQAVHLRPAGGKQVYVDLLYRPYESIYPTEDGLRVHWQRLVSREIAAGYLSAAEKP